MALASSKQARGKRLGKRVSGAVTAKEPEGSISLETKAGEGRTASPLSMDQSLRFDSRYSDCSDVNAGG